MPMKLKRVTTRSYVRTVDFAEVKALGAVAAGDISLGSLPKRFRLRRTKIRIVTPFAGGAISALTATMGKTGAGYVDIMAAKDVMDVAETEYGDDPADLAAALQSGYGVVYSRTASTLVKMHFAATGANLSALTAGAIEVVMEGEQVT